MNYFKIYNYDILLLYMISYLNRCIRSKSIKSLKKHNYNMINL